MMPRRVAYVVNVFPKLSETFIAGELAELRRRGVEARILSLRRPQEELRHELVECAGLVERTVYDASRFLETLRGFRPDVIHAHFATEPTAAARELAGEIDRPFTFTAHGYDVYRRPPANFCERATAAGAVVTVSQANARHLVSTLGVPEGRIRVIPCGVDTRYFAPSPGFRLTLPLLVCVARLVPVKNLGLLLGACADLRDRGLEFRCVIVGEGPCLPELEATREELGLAGVLELVGAAEQHQVLAWWQRASVAVLTSEREGMPVCLMEAAACGVPAVATAVGGIPELVDDGVTGLLVPPGDRPALAAALERLLRDPKLAARMGAMGQHRVRERFSVALQADRLLALWGELLGSGPLP